jgi:hypothetical protein
VVTYLALTAWRTGGVLRPRNASAVEILVRRDESNILWRRQPRPKLDAKDRALLAALRRLLPRVPKTGMSSSCGLSYRRMRPPRRSRRVEAGAAGRLNRYIRAGGTAIKGAVLGTLQAMT